MRRTSLAVLQLSELASLSYDIGERIHLCIRSLFPQISLLSLEEVPFMGSGLVFNEQWVLNYVESASTDMLCSLKCKDPSCRLRNE